MKAKVLSCIISIVLFIISMDYNNITAYADTENSPYVESANLCDKGISYCNDLNKEVAGIILKYREYDKENYAAALSFDKNDKIESFKVISDIFNNASAKEKEIIMSYLTLYGSFTDDQDLISAYETAKKRIASNDISFSNREYRSFNNNYYQRLAVSYAHKYYINYNPSFINLSGSGGDCANFVSQCLLFGGIPMCTSWFYHGSDSYSPSWIRAADLCTELQGLSYKWFNYSGDEIKNNMSSIIEETRVSMGDVIIFAAGFAFWYIPYHVVLVSSIQNNKIRYTAHTNDCFNKDLSENVDSDDRLYIFDISKTFNYYK